MEQEAAEKKGTNAITARFDPQRQAHTILKKIFFFWMCPTENKRRMNTNCDILKLFYVKKIQDLLLSKNVYSKECQVSVTQTRLPVVHVKP